MLEFVMPLDITGEEKLIGGIISLRQVSYIFLSIVLIGFLCIFHLPVVVKVILGMMLLCGALALGFIKIDQLPNLSQGISLDKYLILWWQFKKQQKIYALEG